MQSMVSTKNEHSKSRCRWTKRLKDDPQSMIGFINGAPSTFSMTYGLPVAFSRALIGSINSGCAFWRPWDSKSPRDIRVYFWQGGEAWYASNPSKGNVSASAWWNSKG
jgi:hypothetical protein